jgi:hypothetical protein
MLPDRIRRYLRPESYFSTQPPTGNEPCVTHLLRPRRERPRDRRAAEQRDELAPHHHSITSSAWASSVGGKSRPSTRDAEKRPASSWMGADIFAEIESLARTYERPALRKLFAAFPADTKVA